ncbi:MAG TPA: ASKHA domain-containing protein, partial [Bdellovibrionota bacterium]|nr:ASKHA domain-containing protein [Bdellovibrionota bacterium]
GNSAVTSFAANKDITHLAVAPYQPSFFDSQKIDVYGTEGIEIETLPLLNSFVGGDLFAGLFLLWNQGKMNSTPWILIDVGTNSEIIFWDAERLFISSTPAGPAFEGSNISIGMRADPGSIIHPKYDRQKEQWNFDVIHNDAPLGICGSALIEWMAEALGAGIINDDGEVIKPNGLMLTKDLGLTQDDIREFQLAKSAIRTGLDLVASESPNKPKLLYLAGAFGSHLNLESTFKLGLIPSMEAYTLGNSSLQGTIEWGRAGEEKKTEFIQWINSVKHPIELALRADFQDAFIANMRLTHGEIATSR